MENNLIPIVFTFDRNWILPAAVCFYSLFKHKNTSTHYELTAIHRDIDSHGQQFLTKQLNKFDGSQIRFIEISSNIVNSYPVKERMNSPFSMDCYTK
jgi:lipopolysaccharide biosynthesis glycosyltransferase